jgi:hypothetical protein
VWVWKSISIIMYICIYISTRGRHLRIRCGLCQAFWFWCLVNLRVSLWMWALCVILYLWLVDCLLCVFLCLCDWECCLCYILNCELKSLTGLRNGKLLRMYLVLLIFALVCRSSDAGLIFFRALCKDFCTIPVEILKIEID